MDKVINNLWIKNNKKNYKKTLDKTANVWYYVITERADKLSKRKEVRL